MQNEVRDFLLQQPENPTPLSVIATYVMKKTGCIKPTFYHYLSEMENIRKSRNDSIIVCKLIDVDKASTSLSFEQIDAVSDIELKGNLKRAVNNLNNVNNV